MATYVAKWIDIAPDFDFDRRIQRKVTGLQVQQNSSGGVDVFEGKPRIAEYEGLVYFQGHPAIVEVKATRLNGYARRLPRHLEIANRIYQRNDVNALLFVPHSIVHSRHQAHLSGQFSPYLHIIDTGFSTEEVDTYIREHASEFGSNCKPKRIHPKSTNGKKKKRCFVGRTIKKRRKRRGR